MPPTSPKSRIHAILVDIDGVLIHGRPEDGQPWAATLKADLGLSPADLHREFFLPHWPEIVHGLSPIHDHLIPVLHKLAPHLTADQLLTYWFTHDARINLPLVDELIALRSEGFQVYLASNQEHLRATYLMQTLRLDRCCECIFYSAQLGLSKPDPAFFLRIASLTSLELTQLLLVDDTLENLQSATALGCRTLHWSRQTSPAVLREALT